MVSRISQVLRRFGFFRILTLSLLVYIAVAVMFSTQLPPFAILEAVFGTDESVQEEQDAGGEWIDRLKSDSNLILHVRHTARDRSIDVSGFDSLELDGSAPESINPFVCLNAEGKGQAHLLGFALAELGTPLRVVSSPSCRAKETAQLSVGRIDIVESAHFYSGAIPLSRRASFLADQEQWFMDQDFDDGSITVIFGHQGMPYEDAEWVVREDGEIAREEGGISVMSWDPVAEQLTVHHSFGTLTNFVMHLY